MAESGQGVQMLNISNINAQGKVVLNDGKLLELITTYPFLYNPRANGYKDEDYQIWAWRRINATFNRSYEQYVDVAFSTTDLQDRWYVLKPLINCLSTAYDLESLPPTMRLSVTKISAELDDTQAKSNIQNITPTQKYLLQQVPKIASDIDKLSVHKQEALEREVLDAILNFELDVKNCKQMDDEEKEQISKDVDGFLKDIKYNEVSEKALLIESKLQSARSKHYNYMSPRTYELFKLTRRCVVRIKRINLETENIEDYMPLSRIIKKNNNTLNTFSEI